MAKRDSNIDPFNAGEPVSPWQDPESETRDDEGQEAYGAPHHGDSTPKPPIGQMTGFASNNANGPKEPRTRRRSADSLKREMARQARAQRTRNKNARVHCTPHLQADLGHIDTLSPPVHWQLHRELCGKPIHTQRAQRTLRHSRIRRGRGLS